MRYPIPYDSKTAWEEYKMTGKVQNPGLVFGRFIQQDWRPRPDKEAKKNALGAVIASSMKADSTLLEEWRARWEAIASATHSEYFKAKTDWRFVTGLGGKGPLEIGFTFHRYGFPVLPGSSVKGVARAGARLQLGLTDDEAQKKDEFAAIFGRTPLRGEDESLARSGGAIFFDALPTDVPRLELDIMNPHYPDYYSDTRNQVYPTDWQSPRPVYFLTVAPGTEFQFAVGWRGADHAEQRKMAEKWLRYGLENLGAGAKTSAGYGYFK